MRTGDIALSRSDRTPLDELIALETGSPYVHATMLGWCGPRGTRADEGGVLMLAEARQWRETHLVTLSSQVKHGRGLYDVYRVRRAISGRRGLGDDAARGRHALRLAAGVPRFRPANGSAARRFPAAARWRTIFRGTVRHW